MPSYLKVACLSLMILGGMSGAARSAAPVEAATLGGLAFLAGAWGQDGEVVEYWLPPRGGLMVGVNRAAGESAPPFFEYLRIERRDDGIYYVASPKGSGTTAFRLIEVAEDRVVFENPDHDFPTRIEYVRSGDRLTAEVGADRDGEWSALTFEWSRVPCASAQ